MVQTQGYAAWINNTFVTPFGKLSDACGKFKGYITKRMFPNIFVPPDARRNCGYQDIAAGEISTGGYLYLPLSPILEVDLPTPALLLYRGIN